MSEGSHVPYRVSALNDYHQSQGALIADVGDFRVALQYQDPEVESRILSTQVGIVDISPLQLVQVHGPEVDSWLTKAFSDVHELSVGRCVDCSGVLVMKVRDDVVLLRGARLGTSISPQILETITSFNRLMCVEISHGITGIGILGPSAWEALSMRTEAPVAPHQLPSGSVIQSGFAHVRGTLARSDVVTGPVYELYVSRQYGRYVWMQMNSAVRRLGGSPVGWQSWSHYLGEPSRSESSIEVTAR